MKKKVALSATAIAVLASTVPTQVAPVEAAENVVYVSFTEGNDNHKGNGTTTNPYNLFDDALRAVADGGTIIVRGTGFLNDVYNNGMPYYIDKSVKIIGEQGTQAKLSVRPAGLVLGGNLTLENIALDMYNSADDSIFVNGHTLTMIDVTRFNKSRLVDIFAGTYNHSSKPSYNTGSKSVINITTTGQPGVTSQFGNIYAGSMLGNFDKEVEINLTNGGSVGQLKVEDIKSSGAQAPIPQNIFDFSEEPASPVADPSLFKVTKDVVINLDNVNPNVDGNTGTSSVTSLKYIGKNLITINAVNIKNLELDGTKFTKYNIPQNILNNGLNQLSLSSNAILDLTNYDAGNFNVSTYKGTGAIALPQAGMTVNIANDFTSSDEVTFHLAGYNPYGNNGNATKNHVYFTTPSNSATFNYEPSDADSKLQLKPIQKGSRVEWTVVDPKNLPVEPEEPTPDPGVPDTPNPPEVEEKDPVLTGITAEQPTQTMSLKGLVEGTIPSATFRFNMDTNPPLDNMVWFDAQFNPTIKVDNQEAQQVEYDDNPVYRVGDLVVYFEPDDLSSDLQLQKMVVLFVDENGQPATPTKDTYEFEISVDGVDPLTLTLNVNGLEVPPESGDGEEGGELPPTDPDNGDGEEGEEEEPPAPVKPTITSFAAHDGVETTITSNSDKPTFRFSVKGTGDLSALHKVEGFVVTINNESITPTDEEDGKTHYRAHNSRVEAFIEYDESTQQYTLSLQPFSNDDSLEYIKDVYTIKLSYPDVDDLVFTANVKDADPVISKFKEDNYSKVFAPATEVSLDFEVEFEGNRRHPAEFHELVDSKIIFNGSQLEYVDGQYRSSDMILDIEANQEEVGKYTAVLKNVQDTDNLSTGKYTFTLEVNGKQATLDYDINLIIEDLTASGDLVRTISADNFVTLKERAQFKFKAQRNSEHTELAHYKGFTVSINGQQTYKDFDTEEGFGYYYVSPKYKK